MSTNYYLKEPGCEHCGRTPGEGLHIGKSSVGWTFSLCIYPGPDDPRYASRHASLKQTDAFQIFKVLKKTTIDSLDDWYPLFDVIGVINEYHASIPADQMMNTIINRARADGNPLMRHSTREPFSLCVAQGPGTYDYMIGEFS